MIDRGVASSKGRMKAPANTLFFVFGIFSAAILAIAKGSSLRSRTNFLRKMPRMGTSMAANPARSMDSATASIMPVRIADAHRLCEPSRKVVSTKCTFIERDHRQLVSVHINRFEHNPTPELATQRDSIEGEGNVHLPTVICNSQRGSGCIFDHRGRKPRRHFAQEESLRRHINQRHVRIDAFD